MLLKRRSVRIAFGAFTVLAMTYVVLAAALYAAMLQTPDRFGRIMAHVPLPFMIVLPFERLWKSARSGTIGIGDAAPDFELPTLDHSATVRLSSFQGARPVVLVFGSYT